MENEDILGIRDGLIDFLENRWPELIPLFRNPGNKQAFVAVVRSHPSLPADSSWRNREQEHVWRHAEELWDFLTSGRYHGDPRQIANALAGVPILSWRRSFDICGQEPSFMNIHLRAIRDYLRRKFPDRFRELMAARAAEEAHRIIKRARSDDRLIKQLKQHADLTWQALEAGLPRGK